MTFRRLLPTALWLPFALWLATFLLACGGYSTEEATAVCQDLEARLTQCFAAEGVMQECIACHEDCGRDCTTIEGAACGFTCD